MLEGVVYYEWVVWLLGDLVEMDEVVVGVCL